MWTANRKNSIYTQLLRLLILSACLSMVIFLLLNTTGQYFVENYVEITGYIEKRDQKYVEKLQEYIKAEGISSKDTLQIK